MTGILETGRRERAFESQYQDRRLIDQKCSFISPYLYGESEGSATLYVQASRWRLLSLPMMRSKRRGEQFLGGLSCIFGGPWFAMKLGGSDRTLK